MDYAALIRHAARRRGVPPKLLLAQLRQESGLNPNVSSPAGAQGIAQFMPGTAKAWGVNLNDGDPTDDIDGAARLMHHLLGKYGGDKRLALAAYNAGEGAVDAAGGIPHIAETQNYVQRILGASGAESYGGRPETRPTQTTPHSTVSGGGTDRRALLLNYLENRDRPDSLLELAAGLRSSRADTSPAPGGGSDGPVAPHPSPAGGNGKLYEEFYDPAGYRSPGNDHYDHVHVAGTPGVLSAAERIAHRLGLTLTSGTRSPAANRAAGGSSTSYHLTGQAEDFGGSPDRMAAFAKRIHRRFGR